MSRSRRIWQVGFEHGYACGDLSPVTATRETIRLRECKRLSAAARRLDCATLRQRRKFRPLTLLLKSRRSVHSARPLSRASPRISMETADRSSGQNVLPKSDEPPPGAPPRPRSASPPIAVTIVTTAVVTALSYGLPDAYQATGVGLVFLGATYVLVLRRDSESVRRHGLSL